jgi:fumarate hydratase class I
MQTITMPISDDVIRGLKVGDPVLLSGTMITGRDAAHKWMIDTFIKKTRSPEGDDLDTYEALRKLLDGGLIYHCGPVVAGLDTKEYRFVAAGPTTSIREEPYQGDVMRHFNLKGVIGKGGMGTKTLKASLIAQTVVKVRGVYKLSFGVPEAMWVIEVKDFPAVVTMDAHGQSQHQVIEEQSKAALEKLLAL